MRCLLLFILLAAVSSAAAGKESAVFYPDSLIEKARANIAKDPWAAETAKRIVESAEPWMKLSDDELWDLMLGPNITRSWMVWSDGHCPACGKETHMYTWQIDPFAHPWKVRCPHCKEFFPKNDFHAFYRSGLDEHGVFDPKLADRSLLVNAENPNSSFGIDDGEGYVEGDNRWRFIGAYLVYGQWKQAVLAGARNLAAAYTITGDPEYAHKAAILLDRVADLYPTFDYAKQGLVYEKALGSAGYVSVWHDACEETRELALAYDQISGTLRDNPKLVEFLSARSRQYGLANPKSTVDDIRRNIEERILLDALANRPKIQSNYPRTEIAIIIMKSVLGWPENRDEVNAIMDAMLDRASAVDGVTGEKGLSGYSSFVIQGVANLLGLYARMDPDFLKETLERHPHVHHMFRFHIDTKCLGEYYPLIGDTGWFARKGPHYVGVLFTTVYSKTPGISAFAVGPSMFSFLWQLYEATGDVDFARVLYGAADASLLPYDLFEDDPDGFRKSVEQLMKSEGAKITPGSVNFQKWCLGILRSGSGKDARALWLDYDSGGNHGHADAMNLGLFAKGLDLMPDFGYKPVNYGGWGSKRANWYGISASHCTVVVDGKSQANAQGHTTLWADGNALQAVRASCPGAIGGRQFERTAVMVNVSDKDFYILDVFRVVDGRDHAKFTHTHFGELDAGPLKLEPAPDFGHGMEMRNFRRDASPPPIWTVEWKIDDRHDYLPQNSDVRFRYTDLTSDAEAWIGEGWVQVNGFNSGDEAWIPRVMVRRQSESELASTFVSIIEPYEGQSAISEIKRLPLETRSGKAFPDSCAAVEVRLADGRRDLLISLDAENPDGLMPATAAVQKDWDLRTDAEFVMVRLDGEGRAERIALCNGSFVSVKGVLLRLDQWTEFVEVEYPSVSIVGGRGRICQ